MTWRLCLAALFVPLSVHAQSIMPISGGQGGDGLLATQAAVPAESIALAGQTLYLVAPSQAEVRAVDLGTGKIRAIAGTYRLGRAGEPASSSALATSMGNMGRLAAAPDGTLYVGQNQKIRRIRPNGTWDWFTETGLTSVNGLWATAAKLYAVDSGTGKVLVYDRQTGALQRTVTMPNSLTVAITASADDSLVYSLDNTYVRRISPDGSTTIVAGGGTDRGPSVPAMSATFGSPRTLALASDGTIYVPDFIGNRVAAVKDGTVTTVAGTGAKQNTSLWIEAASALAQPITTPDMVAVNDNWLFVGSSKDGMIYAVERGGVVATRTPTNSPVPTVTAMLTGTPSPTRTAVPTFTRTLAPTFCVDPNMSL